VKHITVSSFEVITDWNKYSHLHMPVSPVCGYFSIEMKWRPCFVKLAITKPKSEKKLRILFILSNRPLSKFILSQLVKKFLAFYVTPTTPFGVYKSPPLIPIPREISSFHASLP